jgi:transcription antitermination factor NusG
MTLQPSWYVVEGREGKAQDARLRLAAAGMHVWMPMLRKRSPERRLKRGESNKRRPDVYIPRFGRYFFVRCILSDSLRHAINDTASVAGLLCAPGQEVPVAIPEEYIAWLGKPEQMSLRAATTTLERGNVVRVVDGPFAGLTSRIEAVDKSTALHLLFDLFGRLTPVILDASQVELAVAGQATPHHRMTVNSGPLRSVA